MKYELEGIEDGYTLGFTESNSQVINQKASGHNGIHGFTSIPRE